MAEENPVRYGDFGDVADKSPERKNDYGRSGVNKPTDWGANPSHTETAKPVKGGTFTKYKPGPLKGSVE
jgi:hypothetical protein